jgi:hypothetical protein
MVRDFLHFWCRRWRRRAAGQGEEDVVEIGGVHGHVVDVGRRVAEPVQQRPQPGRASVAGYLQRQRVMLAERGAEGSFGRIEARGVGEVEPDVSAWDAPLEFFRASDSDHLAVVENGDPVGQFVRLVQLLRGQEDRDAACHEIADGLPHHAAAARVETGGRLVEKDDARVPDQGHREIEPALHAAGVGLRRLGGRVGQVELVEQAGGAPPAFRPAQVVQAGHQQQVLLAGEQAVDRGKLAGDPDRGPYRRRVAGHVMAHDAHLAAVGVDHRGHDLHGGGLAGTVGTQQRERCSSADRQVDAVEDDLVAERLAQPGGHDRRRGCGAGH